MNRKMLFQTPQEVRFGKVLLFVIPTYLTSLFNTLYAIVDGIFVASYVGTDALAAINIAYPIVNVLTGIALLFATGGSSIAALSIGAGKQREADRAFSVSIVGALVIGCLIAGGILFFLTPILQMLGATPVTLENSRIYSMFWLVAAPAVLGKELFTYFIRVDGAPSFSFFLAFSCGILNIVLDYVFVGKLHMGIYGAALFAQGESAVCEMAVPAAELLTFSPRLEHGMTEVHGFSSFVLFCKKIKRPIHEHEPFVCNIRNQMGW